MIALRRAAVSFSALLVVGCAGAPPPPSIAVGAGPGAESALLAHVYASALRYYGSPAHVEQSDDPVADLDGGDVSVVPGFTGRLLTRFDPESTARSDENVYKTMISSLPEGIGAGDYAQSAEDKPALAVREATASAWDRRDLGALVADCAGLTVGAVGGDRVPTGVGSCRLPAARQYPDAAALLAALRAGQVEAAWTSTAAPGTPADVVVLSDRKSLIRAENVVPIYRRNELDERQALALNQIAGELDTGALSDMLSKVTAGTDPGAVAAEWLDSHPLGH